MNFFILASSIIIAAFVALTRIRQRNSQQKTEKAFWTKEREANSVRRKSLESLAYIQIPLEQFPFDLMTDHPEVMDCQSMIRNLASEKIVNFTGITNTDLKLEYGTANITALTEYDQNYTLLVRSLQQWADILCDAGYLSEAQVLMEFAISTGSDISRTYYKLADIYASRGDFFQIEKLIKQAQDLPTLNRKTIVRTLQEAYQ